MPTLPANAKSRHKEQGQRTTKCNRVYKGKSVNVYLRPAEAIQVARHLLEKAQLLIEEGAAEEFAVLLWCVPDEDSVSFGIEPAIKKPRKPKPASRQNSN